MRVLPFFAAALSLCAQTPAPSSAPPAVPPSTPTATPAASAPVAQDPNRVVAVVGGKPVTAAQADALFNAMPPQYQQAALQDRRATLERLSLMEMLAKQAEDKGLHESSPYKERLHFWRLDTLTQARMQQMGVENLPPEAELEKVYKENPDRFTQVKFKLIYLPFTTSTALPQAGAKKVMTEAEAKAKADQVAKEARAGADFVKLVEQYSEDEQSKAKQGEFGALRRSDNVPDAIKATLFAMKAGQISDPVKLPNGFYVFRLEENRTQPFSEARTEINTELSQKAFSTTLDQLRKQVTVEVKDEGYFAQKPPAAPATPTAPATPPAQ